INDEIHKAYQDLYQMGYAHSLEVYDDTGMVGGVYGVALGAAFFGESMFSTRTDMSKIALAHLFARLKVGGFTLFDTQFLTDHLASVGGGEISRAQFQKELADALKKPAVFTP
ncbi:MAG TPA: leucyl/phenylalanyl-tRNA--protein transferase, partial [Rhodobacter sp.]|nr:leucyl/phenylalanyl-tRNA--protein transferase [Rhodobacter sp.]